MRALAEFILRGRTQAILVAMLTAAVPFLFWVSAATVGLITLRKGSQAGLGLLLWAALPALGWWITQQNPMVLVVLIMTWGMALVLRQTVSWRHALVGGVALAALASMLLPVLLPEFFQQLLQALKEAYRVLLPELVEQQGDRLEPTLFAFASGSMAALYQLLATLCLMLARHWQAMLFNPGGFRQEFQELRLSVPYAVLAVLILLFGPRLSLELLAILPAILVPVLIAGFALVHGTVAKRKLGVHWLIAFYGVTIFLGPSTLLLLMAVAIIDSWVNFRGRIGTQ